MLYSICYMLYSIFYILMNMKSEFIWFESIVGSKRLSNYLWALILLFAGIAFILVGISSYLKRDILFFLPSQEIRFAPQGLIMCFYGISAFFLSGYLWSIILWDIGSGYNEYDRKTGMIYLFRWGFPGHNRRIRLRCSIQNVQAIELIVNQSFVSSYIVSLKLNQKQNLTLMQINDELSWKETEQKVAELSQFLQIPIEGLESNIY
jgi:hypothetical protein